MEIIYGARLARFGQLRPIAALASKITKWDSVCDRMLHRLVCYINSSLGYKLKGHICDSSKGLTLTLFSDAGFAGCLDTAKSTSGVFIAPTGSIIRSSHGVQLVRSNHVSRILHQRLKLLQPIWLLGLTAYQLFNYGVWY